MAKKIRVWDGTQWQDVAPALPYTAVHSAQASMPSTGIDGQIWLDTDGTLSDTAFVPLSTIDAKGDLLVGTADNTVNKLTVGSNDTVLTADSSTATGLKWAAPSSGGMTQLASGSLSGASVSLTSISTAYNSLRLVVRNYIPATDGKEFTLRVNNITTASYQSMYNPSGQSGVTFSETEVYGIQNDNAVSQSLIIWDFPDYANTTTWKLISLFNIGNNPTTTTTANLQMRMTAVNTTDAITRIDVFPYTGNFTSGTYILYGVK